jgi:hypothetical protein
MLLLCLLVGPFLCTQITTAARHMALHRHHRHLILQFFVFELQFDYLLVLLQVLVQLLVVSA